MLLTKSSGVIGLETLTVIGTVLPFSTSGGTSSLTLPVRTTAAPTTFRMAAARGAGVAAAGCSVTMGTAPSTAAPPARPRNWRRVYSSCLRTAGPAFLFAERCEIRHHILDLPGRQDRLAAPCRADAIEAVHAIVGRHDRRGVEAGCVDQPKPELALGPAAAGAGEARCEIALKFRFRKWSAVAKDAGAGAIKHKRASSRRVAWLARQRVRNGVANHNIATQPLRAGGAGQGEHRRGETRAGNIDCRPSQKRPP